MPRNNQIATASLRVQLSEFETPAESVRRIMQQVATEGVSAEEEQVWRDLYPLTNEEIAHIEELVYRREGVA